MATVPPFSPGPEGSVIDDMEISLGGAAEIIEDDLGFKLRRGQVVEVTIRGEIGSMTEVDKTVSGGRAVTVRRWSIKVASADNMSKIADPPARNADGQIAGQTNIDDIADAGAENGLSEADEKARMSPVPPPTGEEKAKREAELAAHEAASREAVSDDAPSTIAESAAAASGIGAAVYVMPNGEGIYHGQRWMTPEGKEFVVQSGGEAGGEDVIVGYYKDSGTQDAFPPQSFGATLARLDVVEQARAASEPEPEFDAATAGPAGSPEAVKEHLS